MSKGNAANARAPKNSGFRSATHEQFVYYEIALSEHLSRTRVSSLRSTTLGHEINALWNWPDICRESGGECA